MENRFECINNWQHTKSTQHQTTAIKNLLFNIIDGRGRVEHKTITKHKEKLKTKSKNKY